MKTSRAFSIVKLLIAGCTIVNCDLLLDVNDTTTPEIIRSQGYAVEEHQVVTEDGYTLTMFRIPGPTGSPVIFLQHGYAVDSSCWVLTGKEKSLTFLLADQGYDVWLGNARGTKYSMKNLNYAATDLRFWDFSWHEMGIYDLPAEISYVNNLTKQKVIYVGHSMGTTMFYVMASEKPEIADSSVKVMFSLAPVAFLRHIKTALRLIVPIRDNLKLSFDTLNHGELSEPDALMPFLADYVCDNALSQDICSNVLFLICGYDPSQLNDTLLPSIVAHYPANSSVKALVHYGQEVMFGRFQKYDYGPRGNRQKYQSITPPRYDLSKIQVPVGLFWGQNDLLADPIDVKKLSTLLPNVILNYKVDYPLFNHLDFLWANDVIELLYNDLLIEINKYR